MFKLIQKKFGKEIVLGVFETKLEAAYKHITYSRKDRVFLVKT